MNFDIMTAEAITNTLDDRLEQYMAGSEKHKFSLSYRIKRFHTIKTASRGTKQLHRFTVKHIRYSLLAVILAVFLLTGFSCWYTIGRFTFNVRSNHSVTYLSKTEKDKTKIESIYGLQPNTGFVLADRQGDDEDIFSEYQSGDKKILLCQMVNDDVHHMNTEYGSAEKIIINDREGIFIPQNNNESFTAWMMDGYLFIIYGNVNKNEAAFLAKSTIFENFIENP